MKNKLLLILTIIFVPLQIHSLICKAEQISERNVIKIDSIEITEYELEKRMNKSLPADSLNMYIESFIDRAYILAEATEQGYPEDRKTNSAVEKMAKIIVMQANGGLLYEEVVNKKISISDSEMKEAYKNEKKILNVEYLLFPNYREMTAILGSDSLMASEETFRSYVLNCENNPLVEYKNASLSWPFMNFLLYQDYLYTLKENQITSPLSTPMGVFVLHITSHEDLEAHPFEARKEVLGKLLERAEQRKGILRYDEELLAATDIKIFYDTVEKIYLGLNVKEQNALIEKRTYMDILGEVIMSFNLEGEFREITVEDFVEHYQNQLIRRWINSRIKLNNFLKDWVIIECGYREAEKLGITQTKKFVLDRKNYKFDLVYNKFIRNDLENKIIVDDSEIEQVYQNRIDSFKDGTEVSLSVFRFDSRATAFPEYMKLDKLSSKGIQCEVDLPDSTIGLIGKDLEITLTHDSEKFTPKVMELLFRAGDNSVIRTSGRTDIIFKHSESGSRLKPLEEVRGEIEKQLRQEKLEIMKKELLDELKKKYTIENNIDYDKYLN